MFLPYVIILVEWLVWNIMVGKERQRWCIQQLTGHYSFLTLYSCYYTAGMWGVVKATEITGILAWNLLWSNHKQIVTGLTCRLITMQCCFISWLTGHYLTFFKITNEISIRVASQDLLYSILVKFTCFPGLKFLTWGSQICPWMA